MPTNVVPVCIFFARKKRSITWNVEDNLKFKGDVPFTTYFDFGTTMTITSSMFKHDTSEMYPVS